MEPILGRRPVRVLVTGATGPFGRAVTRQLLASGHEAVAMARRPPTRPVDGADFVAADIQDARAVRAAMTGCDAVVHLAWVVAPLQSEAETEAINLGGTSNVLEAMTSTGCSRLVFSSSVLAYGAVPGHPPLLSESDVRRPDPEHLYAEHKKQAEDMISAAVPEAVLVRAGIVAGRDVDNTIFRFFSSPMLPVPDPEQVQQFVHTDDVARFTSAAVTGSGSGAVNVTGHGTLTMREVAAIIGRPLIKVPESVLRSAVGAAWRLNVSELAPSEVGALLYMPIVDTTRMREEWGFTCAWSSREALTDLARAAHGRVTFGRKTVRLPWRVPEGAESVSRSRIATALQRRTYAGEVNRLVRDLDHVRYEAQTATDPHRSVAQRRLQVELAEHVRLLARTGERHGFRKDLVAVAAALASKDGAAAT